MQHPALSTRLADAAETLADEFKTRLADGELCADDVAVLMPLAQRVMVKAQAVDLHQAAAIARMRGGDTSPRTVRLERQVTQFQEMHPNAA